MFVTYSIHIVPSRLVSLTLNFQYTTELVSLVLRLVSLTLNFQYN